MPKSSYTKQAQSKCMYKITKKTDKIKIDKNKFENNSINFIHKIFNNNKNTKFNLFNKRNVGQYSMDNNLSHNNKPIVLNKEKQKLISHNQNFNYTPANNKLQLKSNNDVFTYKNDKKVYNNTSRSKGKISNKSKNRQ